MKLLVKAPNWVGDCVMATPALAHLRAALPTARITMLARPATAGLWAAHPHLDEMIVADDRAIPAATFKHLRREMFDAAILLPNSVRSAWLAWRLGIPRRFGYSRGARAWLLTDPLTFRRREWQTPTPQPVTRRSIRAGRHARMPRHMVEYYLDLAVVAAKRLGATLPPPVVDRERAIPPLVLPVSDQARARVSDLLTSEHINKNTPLIGVHPGAAYGGAKRWPLDRMARAADALASELGAVVVITAGPGEKELAAALQAAISARTLNLGPRLDLMALAALLERLVLFVGNDTGVTHMAAAVGTPVVVVFGPMDWNVTRPWSAKAVVVRKSPPCAPCFLRECPLDHRCMLAVEAGDVIAAARELLARCGAPAHES